MTALFTDAAQVFADGLRALAMEIAPIMAAVEAAPVMATLRDMAASFAV
ncbi:MAG: hypothetical protein AAF192_07815 [Pseudomonadota bacterium]